MRRLVIVILGMALSTVPSSLIAKDLSITWHAHSMFEIKSSGGATLVIDPHNLEVYRITPVRADVVLISHAHSDHADMRSIRNARSAVRIDGITGTGRRAKWNTVKEKEVKDFKVTIISGLYHDDQEGKKRGKMAAFLIEVDGFRIVHLGDLGHKLQPFQAKKFGKIDILMIPVGGIYTINGEEAKEVVKTLKPGFAVFPMHFGTPQYDFLLKPDEFLLGQKNVKNVKGSTWKIEVGSVAPTKPNIIMLDRK